jgi:hypothetical protein
MGGPIAPLPCLLTPKGGGVFDAVPGGLKLDIEDLTGTTNFICGSCAVWDYTTMPRTVVSTGISCSSTSFLFTIPPVQAPDTKKVYRIQLAFAQVPAYASSANLIECGCGQILTTIDAGRLVLQWQVTVNR